MITAMELCRIIASEQSRRRRVLSPLAELRRDACDRGNHPEREGWRYCPECGERTRKRRETRSYQEVRR